ncbi:MAG: HAMP domain-containing histidine kinase [Roseburia sp.]|nr:HAMP domain-containing histidine kinase [Roseburia sp.]
MGNTHYNNAFKTVAVLMQMVFLIIVIVVFSLLVNLFGRSMFTLSDVGTDSFFDSSYFTKVLSSELIELGDYLALQGGRERSEKDTIKYKQYKMQFDEGDTNLYYWYENGGGIHTNMELEGIGQREEVLEYAKNLGSYLHYDDSRISFEGNIKGKSYYFQRNILRLFQNSGDNGGLIVAVDIHLPKEDAIKEAADVYYTYFPWIETGIFLGILASMCFVLCIIYLTLATGRNDEDEEIRLYRIDYFPMEIELAVFLIYISALFAFCARLGQKSWDIASSLILSGTLVFISDGILLTLYLSLVRKIKADIFVSTSLLGWAYRTIKRRMSLQQYKRGTVIRMAVIITAALFFGWEAFHSGHWWAYAGILAEIFVVGTSVLSQENQRIQIVNGITEISNGNIDYKFVESEYSGACRALAEKINNIGMGLSNAVEENLKSERLKTELITNVSHDIKTPLTSIINYVNLIKMENIQNEKIENYVDILEKKSMRLKQLTEDLMEVSKISSGNIELDMQPINMVELIYQTGGEFNEIFEEKGLTIITRLPKEPVMILADGSRLWRVVQNLYNNAAKYALKDTRVYVELKVEEGWAEFSMKDISEQELKAEENDLSERFVRGDESRGTEGSGLGLSIARSLTNLMGGTFVVHLDGDLFTVSIVFPSINL